MPKIKFTKMHGCGAMHHPIADPHTCAKVWSDRHKGIGSDGLVLIDRSPGPERLRAGEQSLGMADYAMRIFNADGSEAMMCGNASRCIGKYLYEKGFTSKTEIRLLTLSGIKTLYLHMINNIVESVSVDMGEPVFEDETLFNPTLATGLEASFVSMGNPHYVVFTDDVDQVGQTGPVLEHHQAFPQRCNIEFARMEADGRIRTRVWERGSGITLACGTGACATAVAACMTGRAGRASNIVMDGGTLRIEWLEADRSAEGHFFQKNHVYMTGPAAFVFDGEVEIP